MNDDTGLSPVAIGVVIALLATIAHFLGFFLQFARWAQ
jgi:hypothetical protein